MPLDLLHFVRKWNASTLTERSAAQQHFRDLCEALNVPHPTESDEIGESYTYEKRVSKAGTGEQGFADVWKRGFFAWEYKSKGGDLKKAYKQLNEYHESLDNPHLLVVCDFVRFEVHTKFENVPTRVFAFTLDDLLKSTDTPTCALPPVEVLRACFLDTAPLRPNNTAVRVTRAAATDLLRLATRLELESRPTPLRKQEIAHFLMRIVFCLFADSIGLLPQHTFRDLVLSDDRFLPKKFRRKLRHLFQAMSEEDGIFGPHSIRYFKGGLFTDDHVIDLDTADLAILASAASHDWSHIEPTIFGTLFERSLDAAKRSLIGAHYTSTEDILLLIEPVVIDHLRRRWLTVRAEAEAALAQESTCAPSLPAVSPSVRMGFQPQVPNRRRAPSSKDCHPPPQAEDLLLPPPTAPSSTSGKTLSSFRNAGGPASGSGLTLPARPTQPTFQLDRPALRILTAWTEELARVRILDPACGSGNFLYVALRRLLDLWWEAQTFATHHNLALLLDPIPNPQQLFGIETDFYAHEIASVVVWIGFLQWKHEHAIREDKEPLLKSLTNIQHDDAILRYDEEGKPYEPEWPPADYIVGNPPFLGGNRIRQELGDAYVQDLFVAYKDRVPPFSDLVCYWFEKARSEIVSGIHRRAGLLATQGIRGGVNRTVLIRILQSGGIFYAVSDRTWVLDGASVHISIVGFDSGEQKDKVLDGKDVTTINANLGSGDADTTKALPLHENEGLCFMGPSPKGPFDITADIAEKMLRQPKNVNGKSNSDVVRRVFSAVDLGGRGRNRWTIDFDGLSEKDAAAFEMPFEYIRAVVKPIRTDGPKAKYGKRWWQYGRARVEMRRAISSLPKYIATAAVSKHRVFTWVESNVLSNQGTLVFASESDYVFGVLQSGPHEIWSRATGTQLREVESGFRYTPTSTFDTFPFPWPPGTEPAEAEDPRVHAIAEAARTLVRLRDAWLNRPGASEADLKDRTLTKLYNLRAAGKCTWLEDAHHTLDEAVFAAYGWPPTLTTQQILANLLALNHQRAAVQPGPSKRKKNKLGAPPSAQSHRA